MTETPLTARDLQDYRKDHWEALNKAITTLMIAHAAGLVTCLTLIKDYKDKAEVKGAVAYFIMLFGYGLVFGIMASAFLMSLRTYIVSDAARTFSNRCEEWGCTLFAIASVLLLVYAIQTLTDKANVLLP
jgi:uncharacterized membrane protein